MIEKFIIIINVLVHFFLHIETVEHIQFGSQSNFLLKKKYLFVYAKYDGVLKKFHFFYFRSFTKINHKIIDLFKNHGTHPK